MINSLMEARARVDELNRLTKLYDEGHPEVTDKQWDDMYFELKEYEQKTGNIFPDSPTYTISYEVVNSLQKVTHSHPMLSLDKTKEPKEIESFLANHAWIGMPKMDGLTCSLEYKDGKLVRAETRGNGIVGEDITHNAFVIKGIPWHLSRPSNLIVDGEIICTYKDYEEFQETYKNPRNFASGSARLLDSKECENRKLTFVAWDLIYDSETDYIFMSAKLNELKEYGFKVVPFVFGNPDQINVEITNNVLVTLAAHESYPVDGTVFKYNNCSEYLAAGMTSHHFNGGMAFKFYDEEYETVLKDIEWTMGRTGQLTPVAIFDPVDDGESIIERASLHNVSVMRETLGDTPYIDQTIYVYKSNQIIPQISKAEKTPDNHTIIPMINTCPICGKPIEIRQDGVAEVCYCTNPNCNGKLINQLDHFCGKKGLDIKGLSKATLEKLINWEWIQNCADIFTLYTHRSEWIKKSGFGAASVDKILTAIENSKETELWRLIAAAGIPEIGVTASRVLARHYNSWEEFRKAVDNKEDFSKLPDFGYVMSNNILSYDYTIMDAVAKFIKCAAAPTVDLDVTNNPQPLKDMQFCITGKLTQYKNRDALKAFIESLGGKVTGSVTSKTDYLIANDVNTMTGKNQTAKRLNKQIITEKEFAALISELLAQ